MVEHLKKLDSHLFLFLNGHHNNFFDFIFYWISDKWIWIPFYIFLAWKVYQSFPANFLIILLFIGIAVAISDQLSSAVIKESVMRLRPCHDPAIAPRVHMVMNYCGGEYGFVSSHAANVFTLAAFIGRLFSAKNTMLIRVVWIWAAIVSYSRIYLGAHFPGDVIGGALIGILSGSLLEVIFKATIRKFNRVSTK